VHGNIDDEPEGDGARFGAAGQAALDAALKVAPEDSFLDACLRYAEAVEDYDRIRRRWKNAKSPVTTSGSNGQLVSHPLIKEMRYARKHAAQLGALLGLDRHAAKVIEPVRRGRPVGSGANPLAAIAAALDGEEE
jgi:hypothetical protein